MCPIPWSGLGVQIGIERSDGHRQRGSFGNPPCCAKHLCRCDCRTPYCWHPGKDAPHSQDAFALYAKKHVAFAAFPSVNESSSKAPSPKAQTSRAASSHHSAQPRSSQRGQAVFSQGYHPTKSAEAATATNTFLLSDSGSANTPNTHQNIN